VEERQTREMQIVLLETVIDAGGLDSVVEEEVLLNVSDVPTAFGVLYTRLPQTVFEAVQKVCLGLDSENFCSNSVTEN